MKKTIMKFSALLLLGFLVFSCSVNDDEGPDISNQTIVEVAQGNNQLTSLVAALERAGLTSTLNSSGAFTVLAPTNTAFDAFLATAGFASLDDVPVDVLEKLLLNHVIGVTLETNVLLGFGQNYIQCAAPGPTAGSFLYLFIDASSSGIQFNGNADIISEDIPASNGVIHVVDAVIDLPTVSTFIELDDNFNTLEEALSSATPSTDFLDILEATGPFTVFAPNENAFQVLLDSNPAWNSLSDIDEPTLTAVLQHHVGNGNVLSETITDGQTLVTLEGDELTFNTVDGGIEITDGSGNSGIVVLFEDIQANNGVVHLITRVLLPDTGN